jgi:hypothetical protein
MDRFHDELKKNFIELEKYHKIQMVYSGLFMQATTDTIKDPEIIKTIINRHFELMKAWDLEENLRRED